MDFVRDNPGEPVPEETFTHSHLSWSSIVLYLFHPSTMIHSILPVQSTCLTVFFHNLSPSFLWSTSWPGTLHFLLHIFLHPITWFVETVKNCFPRLFTTCKEQIPGFSRTHKTRFQGLSRINSVHKHGCISSKKCTYQISYRCNCITVTVFLKFKLTQKITNCTQHFTMNFFSSYRYLYQKVIYPGPLL